MSELEKPEIVETRFVTYTLAPKGTVLTAKELTRLVEEVGAEMDAASNRPGRKFRALGPVTVGVREGAIIAFFETRPEKPVTRSLEER